jgi:hypothetical protein
MSRFLVNLGEQKEFIYGFDHALGYFYEVWDNSLGEEEEDCIVEDKNTLFNKMPKGEMVEAMKKYGAKEEHIEKVALDLPF